MNFKEQFPSLSNSTYLNTASSGILSKSILQWRRQHDEDFTEQGSKFRLAQSDFLQTIRQDVARFFHGKETNTFLVPNFSFAFNTFLDGLSPNHKFLLISADYPSINYPVESRGFNCEYVEPSEHFEQNIEEKINSFKPSIIALSLVNYTTGIKINLDFIKRLKAEYPNLLIVGDGTQFCGTEDFNFEGSGIDVLISSGYKWMLSGYGNGFIIIKDHVRDYLYKEKQNHSLPKEVFLKGRELLSFCFEPGHLDTLNFGSLKQSILFLENLGADFIKNRIQTVGDIAKKAFLERDLLSPHVSKRTQHSSIFNIRVNNVITERLKNANILFEPRGGGLRVSFHFYNNEQDLDHLLEILDKN